MNTNVVKVSIAKDFSPYPAGRELNDGKYSGEAFRKRHLVKPLKEGKVVEVVFDGCAGVGTSWVQGAFDRLLTRDGFTASFIKSNLRLVVNDDDREMHEMVTTISDEFFAWVDEYDALKVDENVGSAAA